MTTIRALQLPPNPVWRSYAGGQVLRQFRRRDSLGDDHFPEDWLASVVRARNGANSQGPDEGLSQTSDGQVLVGALESNPQYWFGRGNPGRTSPGVLWKLLDAAVRLQLQAHPDAAFARAQLQSNAGKTECWYILGTRGEACVYLGFQRPPSRSAWGRMIREQRVAEMLQCFDPVAVQAGDCFVVPAGTPHAIGAGVFMVELMEPTDWVVRCEATNGGVTLTPDQCFMGLGLESCLDIFDYRAYSAAEVRQMFGQVPRTLRQGTAFTEEEIIRSPWHSFFRLHRLRGNGAADWSGGEMILLIAVTGRGRLGTAGASVAVSAGETWLLPGAAESWDWQPDSGPWEILLAKLPVSTGHRIH